MAAKKRLNTEAQREARKAKAKELQKMIAVQVEELRSSDRWLSFLESASKSHSYSVRNLLLISAQCPHASQVAGFRKWQDLGRQVRRGEKAIRIFGYATKKIEAENETDEEEKCRVYYPVLSVFDVSQTDSIEGAEPIPEIAPRLTGEDQEGLYRATADVLTGLGWGVTREEIPGSTNGFTTTDGSKQIVVEVALAPAQAAKTVLHEAAHALLHADEPFSKYVVHRGLKEVEAESVAYVVAGAFGMDTAQYTIGYVAEWSDFDAKVIEASAKNVLRAAHILIDALTDAYGPEVVAA